MGRTERSERATRSHRLASFGAMLVQLSALLVAVWLVSSIVLPEAVLRPYFAGILDVRGFEPSVSGVLIGNLLPFAGVIGLNTFRIDARPGGVYVLVPFWIIYGLLLGTGSFVLAPGRVTLAPAVLWEHAGYTELLAYSLAFEASRGWAVWTQHGVLGTPRRLVAAGRPTLEDLVYLAAAFAALTVAAIREMS